MKDNLFDNADSFAMSFDEEWKNIDCDDLRLKIDKVFDILSDPPFLISNPENAKKYIQILEDLMETNVSIVSTGPDRKETIDINGTLSNI